MRRCWIQQRLRSAFPFIKIYCDVFMDSWLSKPPERPSRVKHTVSVKQLLVWLQQVGFASAATTLANIT